MIIAKLDLQDERMNLGRELRRGCELSTFYRVSSRDGRLQSGSRDEAETNACSRGCEMRLSRACFFSRTVASGRGFGLNWTQAELRLRTMITDRERLKLSLIGVCKPERKQEQFRVLRD
ncbi:hypothetical protein F2Q70_00018037 [Brassica cretica]|uniref:Uncharacterized protein n=1 Tax=Brassica cretica TaxID=69181 RepID=A0A8S9HVA4_BRACR|nr:hypothetical protein F2Q70_00018037 [Brassica cretica]